jgi:hypothetical protein
MKTPMAPHFLDDEPSLARGLCFAMGITVVLAAVAWLVWAAVM